MDSPRPRAFSYLRMSTPGQLRGDSLHRQLTAAREYVEKHGLDLLEADQLRDIGVSAFKGDNVAEGAALGRFMAAVRSGRIATGSYLLVEDLDRLSRQAIFNSLALVVELVTSGIVVVTLSNGKRYDTTTGPGDLIMSIISMERAHDESRMKSYHKKNSWKAARERAHEKCQRHCNDASAGRSKNTSMMLARGAPNAGPFRPVSDLVEMIRRRIGTGTV
jgi:DNA invertase Pin-like site-specific DNA recombinase